MKNELTTQDYEAILGGSALAFSGRCCHGCEVEPGSLVAAGSVYPHSMLRRLISSAQHLRCVLMEQSGRTRGSIRDVNLSALFRGIARRLGVADLR